MQPLPSAAALLDPVERGGLASPRTIRNAAVDGCTVDLVIEDGRIAARLPPGTGPEPAVDAGGRLAVPGLIETHIHLDKACILDRCAAAEGNVMEAIRETARAKAGFTEDDVAARAARVLDMCIAHGTTRVRTHVELDPGIGLTGFEGVRRAAKAAAWAVDTEICVFPQEGLTNRPGTEALLRAGLEAGARIVGAVPYADPDPARHIEIVFALAREYGVDVDMHLDLSDTTDAMQVERVCDATLASGWGGRVAIGHVTTLSLLPPAVLERMARRLADAGVSVCILPSTDLYLMGRDQTHEVRRGVAPGHVLMAHGVNCVVSTNNVLNPFTPYGDGSLVRMANLFANVAQLGRPADIAECLAMVTTRAARLMRLPAYGLRPGDPADVAVLDAPDAAAAVAGLAAPLLVMKSGRVTATRRPARLHPPQPAGI